MYLFIRGVGELLHCSINSRTSSGFENVTVHAGGDATLAIALHRMGRHRDNR
jgi:hypothetical protein